ncbi:MAG: FlgD immunoglobulin-like domain containing protein, partial [Pedobacter sp.]
MVRIISAVVLLILSLPFAAFSADIEFIPSTSPEFNPAKGEKFKIPVNVTKNSDVSVKIFTSDGDLVATITKPGTLKPGTHEILWDGKDSQGVIVPDEAYVPVLMAKQKDSTIFEVDPRTSSGGEAVENLHVEITPNQEITYQLTDPSRVLVRVGIKNGPMMRALINWLPKTAGKNILRWNGFDSDNLVDLRNHERLSILVTAYKLPANAIIATGNDKLNYADYRSKKGLPEVSRDMSGVKLERDGKRISRNYYMPRYKDRDPKVFMTITGNLVKAPDGAPVLVDSTSIKVDIPEADRKLIQESLYEVAFFVDNEFVSEEEQGYIPLTWIYKPVGLSPGNHILTVNVSSLSGQMGVKSLSFNIPGKG